MSTSKKSISLGLAHEMIVTLNKEGFTSEMAKKVQQTPELAWKIVKLISNSKLELRPQLIEIQKFWKNLYKKYFNLDIDVSLIQEVEGKWAIFIAKGLTTQQVYDALPFNKWKYEKGSLDIALSGNDRISNKDYVVYVDALIEADEKFNGKSANDLRRANHTGITLLERLILELKHFEKTGKHLDKSNFTLCVGSHGFDGNVPVVHWYGGMLRITRSKVSYSYSKICSREVVS